LVKGKIALVIFCLTRQNKNTWFYIGGSGLDQTGDFQKFCRSGLDRITFYRIRTGLGPKNFTVRSSLPGSGQVTMTISVARCAIFRQNWLLFELVGAKICVWREADFLAIFEIFRRKIGGFFTSLRPVCDS